MIRGPGASVKSVGAEGPRTKPAAFPLSWQRKMPSLSHAFEPGSPRHKKKPTRCRVGDEALKSGTA